MSDVKVTLKMNDAGIQSILKGAEVQQLIKEACERVRENAGDGYATNYATGKFRYIGEVEASTYKARKDNLNNNTLAKAMHR